MYSRYMMDRTMDYELEGELGSGSDKNINKTNMSETS
jgi:hypothetical protein